jgi:hypothetical protein
VPDSWDDERVVIILWRDKGWRLAMALMVGELYEALKLAHVPDDKARAVATAVPDFERRIGRIETLVSVNTAVLAMNTALVIAVAGRLFQFF